MFSVKVLKAPAKRVSDVLNVFTKAITDLEEVAKQHDAYANQQQEQAKQMQREADEASGEAEAAREKIKSLNAALGL